MNTPQSPSSRNVIETVLVLLLLLALMFAIYNVLRVFFGIFTFAIIFSVSFAGLFEKLVKLLKQRRKLAAVIYSVVLTTVIALPFIYIISALSHHVKDVTQFVTDVKNNGVPPLPAWASDMPLIGTQAADFWQQVKDHPRETIALHETQIKMALQHILTTGAGVAGVTIQFVAGIIVSAIFLAGGEKMLLPVRSAIEHLLGNNDGDALINTAGQAVRGVAVGVMGTAFIAALISWVGLVIAGIPFALALAALIFFLVLIQVGPLVVWIPLIIWMIAQGHTGWAIFIAVYTVIVMVIDSILKPVLIARSGKLPFLVLFLGVIGGMVAWGFTGMFKGAIILAVFYKVFTSWLERRGKVSLKPV
ncbi:AI-2E family transporter [Foetidibacter luteolus]|uniref:AI-2E family transporter n=1 Tax=Foetidibacter luteolus TaxID=2608880 RepID=UPI00129AABFB|nr:AI-2E family transporter [Foetidibacter luteolus]